jgi:predicted Fe-Mo cluster-binding NifX family protein
VKIAVSSQQPDVNSAIDPRFGRAPYFVIYDTESGEIETVDNLANANQAHGAGTGTAQFVVNKHVDIVVAGNLGPKAEQVLQAAGIRFVQQADGTVQSAIDAVKQ